MAKNRNSFRLVSAFARGLWLMDAEGAHASYLDFKAIVNGTKVFADEDLPDDEIIDPDDDDTDIEPDQDDTGADDDDYPPLQTDSFTGKIAVISITGPIMHYGGPCNYGATEYAERIKQYADDQSISAVIILADTPGGQVQGTQTLADAVNYCKSKKTILGFINDGMVASAGVWFLTGCTEIYASHATCQMGSVGVMSRIMDFKKAMEKDGITEIVTYAPQSTDKNKTYDNLLAGDDAQVKADLKFICAAFISAVSANRGDKLTSDAWNTGKMFFAAEAKKIGLLDGIMPYAKVVQRAMYLATQQNQNNQNTMFGKNKFPALTALVGVPAANVTAALVDAVNTQIEAEKIEGVTLVLDSQLETVNNAATENGAALTALNALLGADAKHTTVASAVAALKTANDASAAALISANAEVANWKAKAIEYGAKEAVPPTSSKKEGQEATPGEEAKVDAYYSAADAELAEARAKAGFKPKPAAK